MKRYIIKYEDTRGCIHIEQVNANDESSAKSKLKFPILEIIWFKEFKIF